VAISAVRFNIVRVSPEKGFTFTWEDALSLDGGSAPFAMYAHTRACAIARRLEAAGWAGAEQVVLPRSPAPGLVEILRLLAVHHDVLMQAVEQHRPHLFALHLLDLATAYNAFYRDCPVLDGGVVHDTHAAVSERARQVLHDGLVGVGIVPLEHM
jgi:arginyl-tRNA synthetase